jgi:hypothetical protein
MVTLQPLSSRTVVTVRPSSSVRVDELAELLEPPPERDERETEELALALPDERALDCEDAPPGFADAAAFPDLSEVITRPSLRYVVTLQSGSCAAFATAGLSRSASGKMCRAILTYLLRVRMRPRTGPHRYRTSA